MAAARRLLLAMLAMVAIVPTVAAQSTIKAIVNNEPVTSYEVAQRARLLQLFTRAAPGTALTRQATEELVEERLKLQEAKRLGINIKDEDVDRAFGSLAQRVKLAPAQLVAALGQAGVDASTLKNRIRVGLAWQQLVLARFRRTVQIADRDVVAGLEKLKADSKDAKAEPAMVAEYTLRQVILVVPQARRAQLLATRKREAEALRGRVTSCDALEQASRSVKEVVIKTIGKRVEDEVSEALRAGLGSTAVGRLTPPSETPAGIEMLAVCDKRDIRSDSVARSKVEEELRQREGLLLERRYISDLKKFAIIEYR